MSIPERWPSEEKTLRYSAEELNRVAAGRSPGTVVTETHRVATPAYDRPDDRFGLGLVVGVAAIVLAAAVVAAFLYTRHHGAAVTTTVVIRQGAAAPTSTVGVAASLSVPSVLGRTRADAAATLRAQGFDVRISIVPGPPPVGFVIRETPTLGTGLAERSAVTLSISNGGVGAGTGSATTTPGGSTTVETPTNGTPMEIAVPDLAGEGLQAAVETLITAPASWPALPTSRAPMSSAGSRISPLPTAAALLVGRT